ncbi:MAG: glycosyltransferase family 2 protein [Vicinamibacterales bacterium]
MKVLALIPARNEADSLPAVIAALRQEQPELDILVVDDASTDTTGATLATLGVEHLRLCEHLGVGSAIRAGLRYALRKGFDIVVRVDGDGQHPAGEIGSLIAPILANAADAAVGSRFGGAAASRAPHGLRRMGQRVASAWVSAASGVRVTDATSGFWAFGARAIRLLADEHPPGYPEPELLLLLARSGLTVAEVPIRMNQRLAGQTTLTAGRLGLACAITALALLVMPLRQTPKGAGGG